MRLEVATKFSPPLSPKIAPESSFWGEAPYLAFIGQQSTFLLLFASY